MHNHDQTVDRCGHIKGRIVTHSRFDRAYGVTDHHVEPFDATFEIGEIHAFEVLTIFKSCHDFTRWLHLIRLWFDPEFMSGCACRQDGAPKSK